ncbi:MAG: hypothetical protein IJC99_03670 [Clostridia bacterium]|nr:hypothetical protein [Clostridia bacterium]
MNNKNTEAMTVEHGEYAVRHSRKRDIIAAVICLVFALVVWLLVMNVNDTAHVPLEMSGRNDAYAYVLSDESLEVAGTVVSLKSAQREAIVVKIPAEANAPGTYQITLDDLTLPEGVALTALPELTLTVSQK